MMFPPPPHLPLSIMMVNYAKGRRKVDFFFFFGLSSFTCFQAYILIPLILVQTRRRKGYEDGGGKTGLRLLLWKGACYTLGSLGDMEWKE